MRMKSMLAAAAALTVGSGCLAETERFDLVSLPLNFLGQHAEFDVLGPGGGARITSTRFVLNYTAAEGEYFAEDIEIGFQVPVVEPDFPVSHPSGLPTIFLAGTNLGWLGHGTFTADFTTTELNGVTVDGDFGLYLMIYTFRPPATALGGQFTNSYIEVEYTPGPAPCPADLNGDRIVDVFDLLAYLDLWFVGDLAADVNGSDAVDVFDLLQYLDGWFAGGCA